MKKILLMLLLTGAVCNRAAAQVQKGVAYLGGTVRFNGAGGKSENTSGNDFFTKSGAHYITPELQWGKFLTNNTLAGIGVRYSLARTNFHSEQSQTNSVTNTQSVHILPFVRQYKTLNSNWAIFIHGEIGPQYEWTTRREKGDFPSKDVSERWLHSLSIKPGVVYQLPNKKWAVEAYANVLSLDAQFSKSNNFNPQNFTLSTGITSSFPSYFNIRIARYFSSQN